MDSDTNIGARIIAVIICIVIGIGSVQIADETYNEIKQKTRALEENDIKFDSMRDFSQVGFENYTDYWYKRRTRQQSNRFAILYSSVFVFCISLCCFTYICVKK